jgi:hypothetical protein
MLAMKAEGFEEVKGERRETYTGAVTAVASADLFDLYRHDCVLYSLAVTASFI